MLVENVKNRNNCPGKKHKGDHNKNSAKKTYKAQQNNKENKVKIEYQESQNATDK